MPNQAASAGHEPRRSDPTASLLVGRVYLLWPRQVSSPLVQTWEGGLNRTVQDLRFPQFPSEARADYN